jgi:hypothetical protein
MVMAIVSPVTVSSAFANTYIAGYPTPSYSTHSQYTMDVNFAGTPTGGRSSNVGAVFSSAAFTNSGDTTPNGWVDQSAIDLQTNDVVWSALQVYDLTTCKDNCVNADTQNLGSIGSGSSNINYVYSTYYWTGSPRNLKFYYEPHFNDGSSTSEPILTYVPSLVSDPSQYFVQGTQQATVGGTNYIFKFYQFGVESNSAVSTTWKAEQYSLTYNGATSYNSVITNSTLGSTTDARGGSFITYASGTPVSVGGNPYTVANAHSHNIDGTLAAGTVQWYESSTGLGSLIRLW